MNHKAIALIVSSVLMTGIITASSFAEPGSQEPLKTKWDNGVEHVKDGSEHAWDATKKGTKNGVEHVKVGSEHAWDATKKGTKKVGSEIKNGAEKFGHQVKKNSHKAGQRLHNKS
jgi:hypothetical protein